MKLKHPAFDLWLTLAMTAGLAVNAAAQTIEVASPTPLISRGVPAHAIGGNAASGANDASYATTWRSNGVPAQLALDLSAVAPAARQRVLLAWFNDETYGYDHALIGQPGYNNVGAYSVQAHAGKGGGAPPQDGWVELAGVKGNTLHSGVHRLTLAGMNWVRLRFTASDGSPLNTDIAINLDVHDASGNAEDASTDGWLFVGDSITANCMGHRPISDDSGRRASSSSTEIPRGSFAQQIAARQPGRMPVQENAGMPGWTAQQAAAHLPGWLKRFPGRYVTLNFGTNDAAANVAPQMFHQHMTALIQQVRAEGKVALLPTIPFASSEAHRRSIPALNAQIRTLQMQLGVIAGPDLFAAFEAQPSWLSEDRLHPSAQGCAAYRRLWADTAVQAVYGAKR